MAIPVFIDFGNEEWQSLNTLSGFDVGTQVVVSSNGNSTAIARESLTKPDDSDFRGDPVTSAYFPAHEMEVASGSDEIWVRALVQGQRCQLSVKEVS